MSLMDVSRPSLPFFSLFLSSIPRTSPLTLALPFEIHQVSSPAREWAGFQILPAFGRESSSTFVRVSSSTTRTDFFFRARSLSEGLLYAATQFPILAALPTHQTAHALSFFTFVRPSPFAFVRRVVFVTLTSPRFLLASGSNLRVRSLPLSSLLSDLQTPTDSLSSHLQSSLGSHHRIDRPSEPARQNPPCLLPRQVPSRSRDHLRRHPYHQDHRGSSSSTRRQDCFR